MTQGMTAEPARDGAISQLWYCAVLSREQIAGGSLATIRQQFANVINAAGTPDGACLFATIAQPAKSDGSDEGATEVAATQTRTIFFSPASVSAVPNLIVLSKARPGPRPERSQVELLVGKPRDWDLLPRSTH
jgi:hypothetical protein